MEYVLYSYFRSTASFRVRIALAWKGLAYRYEPVHLLREGGEQYGDAYRQRNPLSEVPTLEIRDDAGGTVLAIGQSVAILEYLEEAHPEPALLPSDPLQRARVRQLVEVVNSSIHPIQNLRVMKHLKREFGLDRDGTFRWSAHWIERGFDGLEALLGETAGRHAFGDRVTLADLLLVPQVFNARRFGADLERYPRIVACHDAAMALEAFQRAAPDHQPDAE